jgi:hypothetical protein
VSYTGVTKTYQDSEVTTYNYWQILARIKFNYLNKPNFSMYSGAGIGIAMNYYKEDAGNGRELLPGWQFTFLGFRWGRDVAFVGELGVGSLYLLNLGLSYKFGK